MGQEPRRGFGGGVVRLRLRQSALDESVAAAVLETRAAIHEPAYVECRRQREQPGGADDVGGDNILAGVVARIHPGGGEVVDDLDPAQPTRQSTVQRRREVELEELDFAAYIVEPPG